jgi:hypothetical protein
MDFDPQKVWLNARQAKTEDLLNRITVYRGDMEPEAVDIIEAELHSRGVTAAQIAEHRERQQHAVAVRCSFCHRPAVAKGWGWHRWWGKIPLFPRIFSYCKKHLPASGSMRQGGADSSGSPR